MISAIVAATDNDVISKEGRIPWHMPADFARLKKITMGHPIIMGRKTHDAIGVTLPGRLNIVISRDPSYKVHEGSVLVTSLEAALNHPDAISDPEVFIFGGASIYAQALPKTQRIYLTRVHTTVEGDTFFKFNADEWHTASHQAFKADKKNPFDCDWYVLERKNKP
jgi:dihydrofolate reductase